jgi:hypothetical protein
MISHSKLDPYFPVRKCSGPNYRILRQFCPFLPVRRSLQFYTESTMLPAAVRRIAADWIWRAWFCAAVAIIAMCTAGCTNVNWMGDGFHDEFAHWGENLRPAGQPGNLAGVSEQSQEVERDLGVR